MIALGLDYIAKNKQTQEGFLTQEGFSSNLMASSIDLQPDLQLDNPVSVSLIGKVSPTPESQTLPAPNHTPFRSRYTVGSHLIHLIHSIC